MKKSIVAILAVAIIGALGMYVKHPKATTPSSAQPQAAQTGTQPITSGATTPSSTSSNSFKDGTFTGNSEDTAYGVVQIAVVVSGSKIVDINFLRMPYDLGHSQEVTAVASPLLKQTTLQNQSAKIDFVSGATTTSEAYQASLQSALDKAQSS